jgi:hypothetical protein
VGNHRYLRCKIAGHRAGEGCHLRVELFFGGGYGRRLDAKTRSSGAAKQVAKELVPRAPSLRDSCELLVSLTPTLKRGAQHHCLRRGRRAASARECFYTGSFSEATNHKACGYRGGSHILRHLRHPSISFRAGFEVMPFQSNPSFLTDFRSAGFGISAGSGGSSGCCGRRWLCA